jgi:hypothetical protein
MRIIRGSLFGEIRGILRGGRSLNRLLGLGDGFCEGVGTFFILRIFGGHGGMRNHSFHVVLDLRPGRTDG